MTHAAAPTWHSTVSDLQLGCFCGQTATSSLESDFEQILSCEPPQDSPYAPEGECASCDQAWHKSRHARPQGAVSGRSNGHPRTILGPRDSLAEVRAKPMSTVACLAAACGRTWVHCMLIIVTLHDRTARPAGVVAVLLTWSLIACCVPTPDDSLGSRLPSPVSLLTCSCL